MDLNCWVPPFQVFQKCDEFLDLQTNLRSRSILETKQPKNLNCCLLARMMPLAVISKAIAAWPTEETGQPSPSIFFHQCFIIPCHSFAFSIPFNECEKWKYMWNTYNNNVTMYLIRSSRLCPLHDKHDSHDFSLSMVPQIVQRAVTDTRWKDSLAEVVSSGVSWHSGRGWAQYVVVFRNLKTQSLRLLTTVASLT